MLDTGIYFYVPGDDIMHFTDSCRFLISSAFKFTALVPQCGNIFLPHWSLGVLWVPGSILGVIRDLDKSTENCVTAKSNPDSNSGHTDYQATSVPLSQAGLLIFYRTEWTVILTGWGRGLKAVLQKSTPRFEFRTHRLPGHH